MENNLNFVNENIAQNLGKDEKDKKIITELKKIFTGVSQGYTMNLELKGIGYSSSIRHINATTSFEKKKPSLAQISQNMPCLSKHDLFISYGKFELFFSCEDKKSSNNTNLSFSQEHSIKMLQEDDSLKNNCFAVSVEVEDKTTKTRSHYTKLTQIKALKNIKKNENLHETYKKPTKRQVLDLNIGLSHNVVYTIPENHVSINCTTSNIQSNVTNTLTIFGISNAIVNQIAANIYHFKKPEPYKGKGIRYDGEKLFMKPEKKK